MKGFFSFRDDTGHLITCPMLCCSNGTDISLVKMILIRYYGVVCLFLYRDEVLCGDFPGDAAHDGSNSHVRSV